MRPPRDLFDAPAQHQVAVHAICTMLFASLGCREDQPGHLGGTSLFCSGEEVAGSRANAAEEVDVASGWLRCPIFARTLLHFRASYL